ncbi:MAG: NmrA family NAD(P)-binding protein, partial [Myxococcota bacterium]
RGAPVRVYVRSHDKGRPFADSGAEVAVGTFEDVGALTAALRGVQGAFLMQPNDFASDNFIAAGEQRARGYLAALNAAGRPPMVGLSSVGAHHESGNGPVAREHLFEGVFRDYPRATFVRPGYFMSNWANVLDTARGAGVLPTFLNPGQPLSMVAVSDIGACIAETLLEATSQRIIELAGPEDYTPDDVATAIGTALGSRVQLAPGAPHGAIELFTQLGFSLHIAELVQEMYEAYAAGTMAFAGQPRRGRLALADAVVAMVGQS